MFIISLRTRYTRYIAHISYYLWPFLRRLRYFYYVLLAMIYALILHTRATGALASSNHRNEKRRSRLRQNFLIIGRAGKKNTYFRNEYFKGPFTGI